MSQMTRWCAVSDNHGDHADPDATRVFFEWMKHFKPQIRLHLGDCYDFRALRRGASEEERRESMRADIDAGNDFIKRYKPAVWLRGNHDERLWDGATHNDARIADPCQSGIDRIRDNAGDCTIFPYHKRNGVHKLGDTTFVHGYHSGETATRNAAKIYGNVVMGHNHFVDSQPIPGLERRVGRCIGCLCRLDADYNRAQANTLRQAHGWAYGFVTKTGRTVTWQAQEIDGKWILPSEARTYE